MSQPLGLEAGSCQRAAMECHQLPCQADRRSRRDLLTEHNANRELEPVPRARYAQAWSRPDQGGEDDILLQR